MVEVAGRVGGRDVRQQPAADPAAAPRKGDASTPGTLRGGPVRGIEAPAQKRSSLPGLRKQRTRVLALVPRGSQLTMSKRPPPIASTPSGSPFSSPRPVSPGPPGLMNAVPIRSSGLLARWRITARLIVRPLGRSQSSGTRIRAHCNSSLGGSHAAQGIGAPTWPAARGIPARRQPRRRETARTHRPRRAPRRGRTACTESTKDPVDDEFVRVPLQLPLGHR